MARTLLCLSAALPHACLILAVLPPEGAGQQQTDRAGDSIAVHVLDPVVVEGRLDDLSGVAVTASQGFVGSGDLRLRPLAREGELLETVPGMIVTQHSGDGKSNQMFVRGFNLDHGTDFSTKVEGMQVNFPTHAHGQGWTDLNFIVPELVDNLEYKLGNYYADIGDFGSAGGAHLRLRRTLPEPFLSGTLGGNGYRRIVAATSEEVGVGDLLFGGEIRRYDGPWSIPQGLAKLSGMARYSWEVGEHLFSVLALAYGNEWNASDQIPLRLIRNGTIDRFSQVDSTLGGSTSRLSLSSTWSRRGQGSRQRVDFYGIYYDLDLFSDFTYFLNDPLNGDQIEQEDDGRQVLGANLVHVQSIDRHSLTLGLQGRVDFIEVALRKTEKRQVVSTVREDEITEGTVGAYVELETNWNSMFRSLLGLRTDYFDFDVRSDVATNSGTRSAAIVSPKMSLILSPTLRSDVYLSGGLGFHSNDARGTVQSIDPERGEAVDPVVRSYGAELGLRLTPATGWRSTLAAWMMDLDSELLFVGDAGTTEPTLGSRRRGVTWANFYRLTPRLIGDLDLSLAHARFVDGGSSEDRIPGALENVVTAGLTWDALEQGPFVAIRFRRFGEYPLTEDNSVRAESASLVHVNLGWGLGPARLGIAVLNLLDAKNSEIEYFYTSRAPSEPVRGVEGIHLTPTEPIQLRLTASWGL